MDEVILMLRIKLALKVRAQKCSKGGLKRRHLTICISAEASFSETLYLAISRLTLLTNVSLIVKKQNEMKLVSCYLGIDFDLKGEFDWSLGRVRKISRKPLTHSFYSLG